MKRAPTRRNHPEDDEQRQHVIPLYAGAGFDCYVNSTRVKPVGVTPGIADLEVFAPALGFRFVHEVKIGTDRQSHPQKLYQERCDACGVAYVLGDVTAAEDFLVWIGKALWWPRGQLQASPTMTADAVRRLPREHRVFQWKLHGRPLVGAEMEGWNQSEIAGEQRERWGWKLTAGQARKLAR